MLTQPCIKQTREALNNSSMNHQGTKNEKCDFHFPHKDRERSSNMWCKIDWLNSSSVLASKPQYNNIDFLEHRPLLIVMIVGGTMGPYFSSYRILPKRIDKFLAF
jgi:hypothetical protein